MAEQQAQFWTDLRALEARQAESSRLSEENRQSIAKLVDVCTALAERGQETDSRLRLLGEETDRRIRELRDAQAGTSERLNILVQVVDSLVKSNGKRD